MEISDTRFDRQLQLAEVFSAQELDELEAALGGLTGNTIKIVTPATALPEGAGHREILWELEPFARIESMTASEAQLNGCAAVFRLLLKEAVQCRMVSELHQETTQTDYEALENQHEQLKQSEQKYRELSEVLEQKVREQVKVVEEAQRKVYQVEKLASVGQLAAGVAHELNSPLAYIQNNIAAGRGYLQDLASFFAVVIGGADLKTIRESFEKEDIAFILDDFPQLFESCLEGVKRLSAIVADLKVFSNINQQQESLDDLNKRLKSAIKMLKPQIGEKIEFVLDLAEIPEFWCHPAHLGQVFYNLIQNAVQAITGPGRVYIKTSVENQHIRIAIADTGTGIPETDLPRIFDPFFTTKEVGQGTGLGLSVTHDIIRAHKGSIDVDSRSGEGTTFTIYLPIAEKSGNNESSRQG